METEGRLDSSDLFSIAQQRYSLEHVIRPGLSREYATAYEWVEAAFALGQQEGREQHILDLMSSVLKKVAKEHNMYWQSGSISPGNLPNEAYFLERIGNRTGRELRMEEARRLENQILPDRDFKDTFYLHDHQALCRGESININKSRVGEQLCYRTTLNHPQFLLSPLKLEVLSADPPVYVYHEVLSRKDILSIQHHGSSNLSAATVRDASGNIVSSDRTQSRGWLWEHRFPFLYHLARRVGWITGKK